MNPDLDRQPRQPPGRWPFPGDPPLVRARRIAHMYRAHLRALNAKTCDAADETAISFGEAWVVPRLIRHTDDDWLPPAEAADFLCVTTARVRSLRLDGRLAGTKVRGEWRYRVADLRALQAKPRQGRRKVDKGAA